MGISVATLHCQVIAIFVTHGLRFTTFRSSNKRVHGNTALVEYSNRDPIKFGIQEDQLMILLEYLFSLLLV